MGRIYNFSAGPAAMPIEVLETASKEMLDYHGSGMSVMEMSHRSKVFDQIIKEARNILIGHPDYYEFPSIKAEINLFSRDLKQTIDFLDHDCKKNQLAWMSDVFSQISANLKSWEFVDALERAADRFPKACSEHNIRNCIEYAIGVLPDDIYGQRFPDGSEEGKTKK